MRVLLNLNPQRRDVDWDEVAEVQLLRVVQLLLDVWWDKSSNQVGADRKLCRRARETSASPRSPAPGVDAQLTFARKVEEGRERHPVWKMLSLHLDLVEERVRHRLARRRPRRGVEHEQALQQRDRLGRRFRKKLFHGMASVFEDLVEK